MEQFEYKRIFLFVLIILLNACSLNDFNDETVIDTKHLPDQHKKPATFVYECQSGYGFTVNIEERMAWVFLPEKTIKLLKISSASGIKYTDGLSTFWSKGNEAMLERGGKVYINCINNHGKAIWEHAKLKGADFRVVGNEPGWHLKIMQDKELVFTSQNGETTHSFSTSQRKIDPVARKTE